MWFLASIEGNMAIESVGVPKTAYYIRQLAIGLPVADGSKTDLRNVLVGKLLRPLV